MEEIKMITIICAIVGAGVIADKIYECAKCVGEFIAENQKKEDKDVNK